MVNDIIKSSVLSSMITGKKNRIANLRMKISTLIQETDVLREVQHEIGLRVTATMHTQPQKDKEINKND